MAHPRGPAPARPPRAAMPTGLGAARRNGALLDARLEVAALHEREDGVERHGLAVLVRDLDVPGDDTLRHLPLDHVLRRLLLAGEADADRVAGVHRLHEAQVLE